MRKLLLSLCAIFLLAAPAVAQDLYDIMKIRDVKVQFAQSNWDDILDSLKQMGNDDRLIGHVTIDGIRYDSVGIRYKGNSSYYNIRNQGLSKLPFNIKIDYTHKKMALPGGYSTLKLSNVFRDPSFLREVLSYEIVRRYMPAPKANFVRLYINDKYMGLYNNTESINKKFLKKNYGYSKGTLLKCDPNWHAKLKKGCIKGDKAALMYQGDDTDCYKGNYELKSNKGWKDLVELTKALNQTPEKINQILNVDQVIWMHAFNNVIVNLDSYSGRLCHNYYLYRDSFDVFHPLVWDMNLSFGGFRHDGTGTALNDEQLTNLSLFIHYRSPNRPLISQILTNSLNRKVYIAHIRTIIKDHFENGAFEKRAAEVHRLIDTFVQQDDNKLYTYDAFKANIKEPQQAGREKIVGVTDLMANRITHLKAHKLLLKEPPVLSSVEHQPYDEQFRITARTENAEKLWLLYRQKPKSPFVKVRMADDGANGDNIAGDQTYSVVLPIDKGTEYYIIAENEKAAALSPERASFEFHTVD